jgi:alkylation response protein AidB-like acyl-CoA dehydrogenase
MDFALPADLAQYLRDLDAFIDSEIIPLQNQDDNNRFFDHRREHARTDWDNGGLPRKDWEALLSECVKRADAAGFYRFALPKEFGGQGKGGNEVGRGSNFWMAVIREHLASKGLGLFNDLQTEHSIVGNFPDFVMVNNFGTESQKRELVEGRMKGEVRITFGLTEPDHGSDATHMETSAVKETRNGVEGYRINGSKKWNTGAHHATHAFIFARTGSKAGDIKGITCFIVDPKTPGFKVESYEWYVFQHTMS